MSVLSVMGLGREARAAVPTYFCCEGTRVTGGPGRPTKPRWLSRVMEKVTAEGDVINIIGTSREVHMYRREEPPEDGKHRGGRRASYTAKQGRNTMQISQPSRDISSLFSRWRTASADS